MLTRDSQPESRANLRPLLLDDVAVWTFHDRGSVLESTYIIGSVTVDRYLTIPGSALRAVKAFMQRLNGRNTLVEIHQSLVRDEALEFDVCALHRKFRRAGLLVEADGRASGDIQEMSTTFAHISINGLLRASHRFVKLMRPLAYLGLIVIAVALILALVDPVFRHPMTSSISTKEQLFRNLGITVLIGVLSVALHEFGHCLAAASWGIRRGVVKAQLYLGIIPLIGLKFAGLYTLPAKGRVVVWSAGIFVNLLIVSVALLASRFVLHESEALRIAVTINWFLTILNLIPLLATDGYFILSTLAKDSNVRVRSWNWLRKPFQPRTQKLSWFVVAYIVATFCLLAATLQQLVFRVAVDSGGSRPLQQTAFSTLLLLLFVVSLWRTFQRKEDSE